MKNKIKKSHDEYNETYYERGISSGKSGYDNYRWLPELTIKFAYKILKELNLKEKDNVLDFGCAKGFIVKALRILDIKSYGCDVSKYAIENVDKEVKDYCKIIKKDKIPFNISFDWTIAKDVFEHLYEDELNRTLNEISKVSENLFVVIPLGKDDKFIIPAYNLDITHKLAKSKDWWKKKFESQGWNVEKIYYTIKGMKENWSQYRKGNGFFFLKKR